MSFRFFKKRKYLNKDINPEDIFVDMDGVSQFDEDKTLYGIKVFRFLYLP